MGGIQPIGSSLSALPVQPTEAASATAGVQATTAAGVHDVLALSNVSAAQVADAVQASQASGEIAGISPAVRMERVLALREAIAAGTYETQAVVDGTVSALWDVLNRPSA